MNRKMKIVALIMSLACVFSCFLRLTTTDVYAAAGKEQLNRTSIVLIVNSKNSAYGKATLRILNSTGAPTFKSSNTKIATVGTDGVVTAVKAGKCNVTAKIGKKTYTCKVTVKNAYSTKSLKENFKISSKVENGVVKFTVVNKYNHPMFIEVIGTEIKADGSNSSIMFNSSVPAKATTYFYRNLSAPTSSFIFEKRTFSYTNGSGVGRCVSENKYMGYRCSSDDYLSFKSSTLGFNVDKVRVEPYEGWFDSGVKVFIDGDFHNNTPIEMSNGYVAVASSYILFYNQGELVHVTSLSNQNIYGYSGTGVMKLENKELEKTEDWDGVYDKYKIVTNSKSLLRVN